MGGGGGKGFTRGDERVAKKESGGRAGATSHAPKRVADEKGKALEYGIDIAAVGARVGADAPHFLDFFSCVSEQRATSRRPVPAPLFNLPHPPRIATAAPTTTTATAAGAVAVGKVLTQGNRARRKQLHRPPRRLPRSPRRPTPPAPPTPVPVTILNTPRASAPPHERCSPISLRHGQTTGRCPWETDARRQGPRLIPPAAAAAHPRTTSALTTATTPADTNTALSWPPPLPPPDAVGGPSRTLADATVVAVAATVAAMEATTVGKIMAAAAASAE